MKQEQAVILTQFGISPTAAKVYLALLELGKASADAIAKRVGTYKANVYDALSRLIELGMAAYIVEGRKKLYLPASPEKLIAAAEESKQREIEHFEELKSDLAKILPQLSARYNSVREKDIFEVYRGKKAYKSLITEILKEKPKYWKSFGNLHIQEVFPREYPVWFRHTTFYLFAPKFPVVLKRLEEARKGVTIRVIWLPGEMYMPVVWTIFGSNLLIVIYEPDIIALRIKSEQIVKTFRDQLEYLWKKHEKRAEIYGPARA